MEPTKVTGVAKLTAAACVVVLVLSRLAPLIHRDGPRCADHHTAKPVTITAAVNEQYGL
jgi:hypothetical protein